MMYDYHCVSTDHHDYLMMNTVILMVDDNKFKTIMMMHRMLLFPTHKALLPCNRNHRLPRPPRWPHSYGRWKVFITLIFLVIVTIFLVIQSRLRSSVLNLSFSSSWLVEAFGIIFEAASTLLCYISLSSGL